MQIVSLGSWSLYLEGQLRSISNPFPTETVLPLTGEEAYGQNGPTEIVHSKVSISKSLTQPHMKNSTFCVREYIHNLENLSMDIFEGPFFFLAEEQV